MKAKIRSIIKVAAAMAMVAALAMAQSGCSTDVDDERIPRARVYIPFTTIGDWNTCGVNAALDARRFVPQLHEPAGYQWSMIAAAGYGGVLLTCDIYGERRAFDLACPVERDPQVRVAVDRQTNVARCAKCGSTYDVFGINGIGNGIALSGPAAEGHRPYALRPYTVLFGVDSRYALISN